MDSYIKEDYEQIFKKMDCLDALNSSTILITGATGLIGSHLVKSLCYLNLYLNEYEKIHIIALARSEKKFNTMFSDYLDNNLEFLEGDILTPLRIEQSINYIIHGASITDSIDFITKPVETIITTIQGTTNILELAKEKKIKSLVYLSSLEIYGQMIKQNNLLQETEYGFIDFLNVRSSYSEGKRMAECLCASYVKEYMVPVHIARLAQTFGPGIDYSDRRVFAEFARSVIKNNDIILHTKGDTERSYCYISDAIHAIFVILLKGSPGEAYNVANPDTYCSIRDMAQTLCNAYKETDIKVIFDCAEKNKFGYNQTIKINLDTKKLENLGWHASTGLLDMYRKMIHAMMP